MKDKSKEKGIVNTIDSDNNISRRNFLKIAGVVAISTVGLKCPGFKVTDENEAHGYILVDSKKCQGCAACMLACSLVHEGCANYSLSRIQILQNSFAGWPDDIGMNQCRQCVDPKCVDACTTGALQIDVDNGNVRRVRYGITCSGCGECVRACPYEPKRPIIAEDDNYGGALKSKKAPRILNYFPRSPLLICQCLLVKTFFDDIFKLTITGAFVHFVFEVAFYVILFTPITTC